MTSNVTRLGKLPEVLKNTGDSRSSHYDKIHKGLMIKPVQIGERAVAYPMAEIEAINRARIAGKSDDEIKTLVAELIKQRKAA